MAVIHETCILEGKTHVEILSIQMCFTAGPIITITYFPAYLYSFRINDCDFIMFNNVEHTSISFVGGRNNVEQFYELNLIL